MVRRPQIVDYLHAGLKAAALRQSVIANNIANFNTPQYRRAEVEFERRLAEAIATGRPVRVDEVPLEIVRPMNRPTDARGNDVDLETEVGEMVKNNALYKTYLRLLGRTYRQMELAIRGDQL